MSALADPNPHELAPMAARRCGAWLFRHRSFTLVPLAVLVGAAVPSAFEPSSWLAGICLLLGASAIRLHVAGRAQRGTSSRGVTFEAGALITTGMYAHTRNPLYLANTLIWCGMALLTGSLAVTALVVFVSGLQHHLIILAEEHYLGGRYGRHYAEYRRRVPRWIPRVALRRRRGGAWPSPAPFTWRRALFREADTLFLLALGAWLLSGLSLSWARRLPHSEVAAAWLLLPAGPAMIWLAIKGLKKTDWSRARRGEPATGPARR